MLEFLRRVLSDTVVALQEESLRRISGNPFPLWRTELFYDDESRTMTDQPSHTTDVMEHGLVLPNGQVLWGQYHHWPLDSPEQRSTMVKVLRKTAEECGFPEEEFLSYYTWVTRRVQTVVTNLGTFPITASEVIEASETLGEDQDGSSNYVADNGDGGDIRQGFMGSTA